MLNKTFKQQFDKITEAYIKGEIKPYDCNFCFCGTLSPDSNWGNLFHNYGRYDYTVNEYRRMEEQLLFSLRIKISTPICFAQGLFPRISQIEAHPDYEDILFLGMCNALDELRKIHEEHGEIIEEHFVLPKREKVLV